MRLREIQEVTLEREPPVIKYLIYISRLYSLELSLPVSESAYFSEEKSLQASKQYCKCQQADDGKFYEGYGATHVVCDCISNAYFERRHGINFNRKTMQ